MSDTVAAIWVTAVATCSTLLSCLAILAVVCSVLTDNCSAALATCVAALLTSATVERTVSANSLKLLASLVNSFAGNRQALCQVVVAAGDPMHGAADAAYRFYDAAGNEHVGSGESGAS